MQKHNKADKPLCTNKTKAGKPLCKKHKADKPLCTHKHIESGQAAVQHSE